MKNYKELAEIVKNIAVKNSSGKYVFWSSRTYFEIENSFIFFKFDHWWCLIYDKDTKLFHIPSIFFTGSFPQFKNTEQKFETCIFSTGDSAIDFQNSLLYTVIHEGDETFDCIFEYMLYKNIIKSETT